MARGVPITCTTPTGPSKSSHSGCALSVIMENFATGFTPAAHVCLFLGGWQAPLHVQPSQQVLPVVPPHGWKATLQPELYCLQLHSVAHFGSSSSWIPGAHDARQSANSLFFS